MQLAVYRRDNRRRGKRDARARLWLAAALIVSTAAAAGFWYHAERIDSALDTVRGFVVESPYFSVREIKIRGSDKVGGGEIAAIAGLKHGMNIWKIDPAAIEKKIARQPWVRRVVVRREFPRRVVIEIEERVAKAIVAAGKLYYVDGDGVIFKELTAGEDVEFPLVTGLKAEELSSGDPLLRARLKDAVRLGDLMTRGAHTISEIHLEAADRVVLYTVGYPVALHMGSGDWEGKVRRLDRILGLWKGHEERLISLDMSFRDQVVARLKPARP